MFGLNFSNSQIEARNFADFTLGTKQLVQVVLGQITEGTDKNITYLGKNLRRSEAVIQAAENLRKNDPLIFNWQIWLQIVLQECLRPFHEESYLHLIRVRSLINATKKMIKQHGIHSIPNYGYVEFQEIQKKFKLTDEDWNILDCASWYHDLCKMAYELNFWNTPGKFTPMQRKELEAHARLFFYLGEFFNVHRWVIGLSVLHHYPNHNYPVNGVVASFADLLCDDKFNFMLRMLIPFDVYEGITGHRGYHRVQFTHQQAIKKMPDELGNIGTGYLPLLEALYDTIPGERLCPHN